MTRHLTVDKNLVQSRRQFLKAGGVTISCVVAGKAVLLSPAEAYAKSLDYQTLSATEVAALEALAEAIVPGATKAGIAHYIDSQLSVDPKDTLLMLKYLVPPPFAGFYQASLASADKLRGDKAWIELSDEAMMQIIGQIATDQAPDWQGPPASFFYFVFRSDAVDVVYGTPEGSDQLGIPYRAHIRPEANW